MLVAESLEELSVTKRDGRCSGKTTDGVDVKREYHQKFFPSNIYLGFRL